ncbi:hypothetical protein OSH48_16395, partial [Mycobacterium ulcerans]
VGSCGARALAAATARAPHDPTHPSAPEAARPSRSGGPARTELGSAQSGPSSAGTKEIQTRASQPSDPPTTRLTAPGAPPARGSSNPAPPAQTRPTTPAPPAPAPPPAPSAGQTRAMQIPTNRSSDTGGDPADPTAALPIQRPEGTDTEAATEQLNARGGQPDGGENPRPRRRGAGGAGGLSAQDLLRREGRL